MDGLRLEEPEVEHALSQLREEGVVLLWATQDEMFRRVQGTWNSRSLGVAMSLGEGGERSANGRAILEGL